MGASCCKLDHAVKPDRSDCPSYSGGASGEVGEEEKRDEPRPNPLQIARPSIPHSSVDLPDVGTIHNLPLLDRLSKLTKYIERINRSIGDMPDEEVLVDREQFSALLGAVRRILRDPIVDEAVASRGAEREVLGSVHRRIRQPSSDEGTTEDGDEDDEDAEAKKDLAGFVHQFVTPEQQQRLHRRTHSESGEVSAPSGLSMSPSGRFKRAATRVGRMAQLGRRFSSHMDQQRHVQVADSLTVIPGLTDPDREQVMQLASSVGEWNWDIFRLQSLIGQSTLPFLGSLLLRRNRFVDEAMASPRDESSGGTPMATPTPSSLKLTPDTMVRFLRHVAEGYLPNPYHNSIHAADVLYTTHCLLTSPWVMHVFSPEQRLAVLLGAIVHDFRHPGWGNPLEVKTSSDLAITYNDKAVLENMHVAEAFRLMRNEELECNILETLSSEQYRTVRQTMIDVVLATDMSHHFVHLADFKAKVCRLVEQITQGTPRTAPHGGDQTPGTPPRPPPVSGRSTASRPPQSPLWTRRGSEESLLLAPRLAGPPPGLSYDLKQHSGLILSTLLHAADISNPTKPIGVYEQWAQRVMEEFYSSGDREKELGLPVSPFCDREKPALAKCQTGFIDFIVKPTFDSVGQLLQDLRPTFSHHLTENREFFAGKTSSTQKQEKDMRAK